MAENPDSIVRTEAELINGTILDTYSAPVVGKDNIHYGRIWIFHDITERKKLERDALESEASLRALTESIPTMVWIIRPDGFCLYANHHWEDFTGLSNEDCYGFGWRNVIHPEDQMRQEIIHAQANIAGEPFDFECRFMHRDGNYRWNRVMAAPVRDSEGLVTKWVGTCTDIHERHLAEEYLEMRVVQRTEQLELSNRQLLAAKTLAVTANQAKSEFLSRISHELRTPLNSILGFGQLLEMACKDPEQCESVAYILKAGRHLLFLIDEILDITKVDSGQSEPVLKPVNISDLVGEVCTLLHPLSEQSQVSVQHDLSAAAITYVKADPEMLKQVLMNLISNGLKYNQIGGSVEVYCCHQPGDRVVVTVGDTGWGISEDNLERLFTPFDRLEAAHSTIEGSGLGLVLVQRFLSAMGSSLRVSSELGKGSVFSFELVGVEPTDMNLERVN